MNKKNLLKNGVFGIDNDGEKFVIVNDTIIYQDGQHDEISSLDDNLNFQSGRYILKLFTNVWNFNSINIFCMKGYIYDRHNPNISNKELTPKQRAKRLHKKLRKFARKHNEEKFDWEDEVQPKCFIYFNYLCDKLFVGTLYVRCYAEQVYFTSREIAEKAVEKYRDELEWYFKEYERKQ